ncbi:MAG: hypothetical protein M1826_004002 [Phylliscum demangeonii]|nr:MAG: hypothetical protein M1826_004002 [Phylliscum demangeonii]
MALPPVRHPFATYHPSACYLPECEKDCHDTARRWLSDDRDRCTAKHCDVIPGFARREQDLLLFGRVPVCDQSITTLASATQAWSWFKMGRQPSCYEAMCAREAWWDESLPAAARGKRIKACPVVMC